MVNTVGSVGRITGVEGGVRWILGGRRPSHHSPSDMENETESSHKRRKVGTEERQGHVSHDLYSHRQESQHRQRAPSQASTTESLPAYDDYRSPSYEPTQNALVSTRSHDAISPGGSTWQSRLVLSTSGLSVAMSEESLRSLKYCLNWLKWANEHIGKVIHALKTVLEQYDQGYGTNNSSGAIENGDKSGGNGQLIVRSEAERTVLNAKIAELKKDVLKTLKEVVDIVSKYAGGALPENARLLVRRHLTSLPQRFKLASSRTVENGNARTGEKGDREVTEGANRVLVLAKEGLDMMSQVSDVLDGTIVSAEEWCERLGKSKREDAEREAAEQRAPLIEVEKPPGELPHLQINGLVTASPDVKMG